MTYRLAMRIRTALTVCCFAAALALPATATAGSCAPPGNSGVDQYFETVPGAGCNQGPGGGGNGGNGHNGGGGGGSHLSPTTNHQLAAQGAAGRAVQRLVSSTAPASVTNNRATNGPRAKHHTGAKNKSAVGAASASIPPAPGRSLISALLHPILTGSASGGTGVFLPIFLAAIVVLAIGALVMRRRRVSS
jgi:hypothetical protein